MSDLDRNYASPFGRAAGRVDAATVDAGLRSYMLRIYNYMSIGLAITGLAALGVYMAAVTTDQAGAAAEPQQDRPVRADGAEEALRLLLDELRAGVGRRFGRLVARVRRVVGRQPGGPWRARTVPPVRPLPVHLPDPPQRPGA